MHTLVCIGTQGAKHPHHLVWLYVVPLQPQISRAWLRRHHQLVWGVEVKIPGFWEVRGGRQGLGTGWSEMGWAYR